MRQFIIHRQRALAGFALRYACVVNQSPSAYLAARAEGAAPDEHIHLLGNGDSCTVDIGEECATFFVAVHLEKRNIITDEITIPAGAEDVSFVILTEYNTLKGMGIAVVPET